MQVVSRTTVTVFAYPRTNIYTRLRLTEIIHEKKYCDVATVVQVYADGWQAEEPKWNVFKKMMLEEYVVLRREYLSHKLIKKNNAEELIID